jgi:regulator of RNase E activity RraA
VTGAGSERPIGAYIPPRVSTVDAPTVDPGLVEALRRVPGLSSAFSDELDRLGIAAAVPASVAPPLRPSDVVVGRAVTIRYLPTRSREAGNGRLAHLTLFEMIAPGDVAVISAPAGVAASVLGGKAAGAAVAAGLGGLVAFGAVRDIDEILVTGLPVWATTRTLVTGRGRIEAVEINGPLDAAGVQVVAGDIVVADASGSVFVPNERFEELARRVLAG